MKQMLKLGVVLMAYTAIACVGLAFVNNLTAPAIAANEKAELNQGLKMVFASAESFDEAKDFESKTVDGITLENLYIAKAQNNKIGCIIKASGATYDKATMLIGIDKENKITSIQFLALSDYYGILLLQSTRLRSRYSLGRIKAPFSCFDRPFGRRNGLPRQRRARGIARRGYYFSTQRHGAYPQRSEKLAIRQL